MNAVSVASLPFRQSGASTAVMYTFASMSSVQIGAAASTGLFAAVGPGGTAWLRVSWAAVGFVLLARPRLRGLPRRHLATAAALGVVSAGMTLLFFEAISRIPLATSVAIEFLGPLAVAVWRRSGKLGLLWPALALGGVLAMTRPWQGDVSTVGLACALGAAICWAGYILLMQRVGDGFEGVDGLAISMPAGAVVTTIIGMPQALGNLSMSVIIIAGGLALLLPMIPYALELLALRRLSTAAFGTLMCAEPALALLAGAVMLHQIPDWGQLIGIAVVCVAGVGAVRTGGEREPVETAPAKPSLAIEAAANAPP